MKKHLVKANHIIILMILSMCSLLHAEVVSNNADLTNNKRIMTYLFSRPMIDVLYQHGVLSDRKFGLLPECKTQYNIKPIGIFLLEEINFPEDRKNPLKGAWNFRYTFERCGESKVYNTLFMANQNDEMPIAKVYYPGTTNASPQLIKDAMLSVLGMAILKSNQKECRNFDVFDMNVLNSEQDKLEKGAWLEKWILKVCNQSVDINIVFTPNTQKGGVNFSVKPL